MIPPVDDAAVIENASRSPRQSRQTIEKSIVAAIYLTSSVAGELTRFTALSVRGHGVRFRPRIVAVRHTNATRIAIVR
ncbi:hypothetical protein BN2475_1360010 [Paraburkholderia ribeironis]|uniref:Uncharacterized protein n=1 Tax=Paraburkholderia ribeironis TaxID=1247936 RepID=A0A1N7SPG7_9BURK|nr:hypothetical protein [Paraburkholderia ribeironis]SIT49324.1 hypothetical protein BN2475_1360010 [Paraburkholderia ribeironis]